MMESAMRKAHSPAQGKGDGASAGASATHDAASPLDGGQGVGASMGRAANAGTAPGDASAVARPPLVDSADLLRGHTAIEISHQGMLYRLQATRLGKLILTK